METGGWRLETDIQFPFSNLQLLFCRRSPVTRLRQYGVELTLVAILMVAVGFFAYLGTGLMQSATSAQEFSGRRALDNARRQVDFGPRVTGTESNKQTSEWLAGELLRLNWDVIVAPFTLVDGVTARNLIAVRKGQTPNAPVIVLGAHYDSRLAADADPGVSNHTVPTPGANAGAAGTALLLELARTLDVEASGHTICLVFFDAEENSGLPGWQANMGSRYFLERIDDIPNCLNPRLAVVVDLVGNTDQRILVEQSGDMALSNAIWQVAGQQGYSDRLRNEAGGVHTTAHTIFRAADIPAVVVADFSYPYRYTLDDTVDKLDDDSFEAVGRTLESWLEAGATFGNP
jgi:glutaminyl-peptide cyclotransferase